MSRSSGSLLVSFVLTFVLTFVLACATYDDVPGRSGGSAGRAGDGGASGASGKPSGGAGGSGGSSDRAGAGGGGSSATGGGGGAAGDGAAGMGGDPVSGAGGDAGGEGGEPSLAGAAGSGGADCDGVAPEAGCSCESFGAHDYWFCSTFLTFGAAENECGSVGMHLVSLQTEAEDDWLVGMAATKSLGEYFLGATDASTPNEWSWLSGGRFWSGVADGTATGYANWAANEPNASGDCVVMQSNGVWDDRICTDQRKYVCEAP